MNLKDVFRSKKKRQHRSKAILLKVDPENEGNIEEGRTEKKKEDQVLMESFEPFGLNLTLS